MALVVHDILLNMKVCCCSKQVCAGSSLFLRARFGNGYYLTLVRDDGISKIIDETDQEQQQQQLQLQEVKPIEEENSLEEVRT